jgi:hypothetical protein
MELARRNILNMMISAVTSKLETEPPVCMG